MTTIYHNPRCSKSRETLAILEERNEEITIVKYLDSPPTLEKLKEIIGMLGIEPIKLVRKNEPIWKEQFKSKDLTDEELLKAMVTFPKLIERPIVIKNNKAILGRPPQQIISIL